MTDIPPLATLLPLLRQHGVASIRFPDGLHVTMGPAVEPVVPLASDGVPLNDLKRRMEPHTTLDDLHAIPGEQCRCGHDQSDHNGQACGEGCDRWQCAGHKSDPNLDV